MNLTKQTFNLFLLTALAFSPDTALARKPSTRGAAIAATTRQLPESADGEGDGEGKAASSDGEAKTPKTEETGGSEDSSEDESEARTRSYAAGPKARKCESEGEDDEYEFKCKAETVNEDGIEFKDEIKFKVSPKKGGALKIKISYEQGAEDDENDAESETETSFTAVFDRMIEYRKAPSTVAVSRSDNNLDLNNPGHEEFEWDSDEVVSELKFDSWSDFTPLESSDGVTTFSASTLDGMATFSFYIHEVGDDMQITANNMKIDFLMENYGWASTGDTYLALVGHIETKRDVDVKSKKDKDGESEASDVVINFVDSADATAADSFITFGRFTWDDTAVATQSVEGGNSTRFLTEETVAVVATTSSLTSNNEDPDITYNEIAYSFTGAARGASRIYWDPEAGIGYDVDPAAASGSRGAGASGSTGSVLASFSFACTVSVMSFFAMM